MINFISQMRLHFLAVFGRHIHVAVLFAAATVAMLFASAYLLMAAQIWLTRWYDSPIEADLTVAGVLACLALGIGIVGERVRRSPTPEMPIPVSLAVAAPVAVRLAPKLLNAKVLGIASAILGAVLIRREFSGK